MTIAWLSNLEEIRTNLNSPCTFSSIWKKIQKKNTSCIITVSFEISYHCYSLSSFLITARNQSLTHIFENSKNEIKTMVHSIGVHSMVFSAMKWLFDEQRIVDDLQYVYESTTRQFWFSGTHQLIADDKQMLLFVFPPFNNRHCMTSYLHLQTKKDNCSSFIFFQWHFFYRDMNYWKAPKNWNRAKIRCSHQ